MHGHRVVTSEGAEDRAACRIGSAEELAGRTPSHPTAAAAATSYSLTDLTPADVLSKLTSQVRAMFVSLCKTLCR